MIRLACATLSVEGFGETDFSRTFDLLPRVGFRFVEFNLWHPSSLSPAVLRGLAERSAAAGLEPVAVHLGGGLGGDPARDYCHKVYAMQAARLLGAGLVVTSGGARGRDGGLESVIRSLRALVPVAEELGVDLALENHIADNLESPGDYTRVFDVIESRRIGLCIDTGHFEAAGVPLDEVVDAFAPRVNHIHLKENRGMGRKVFTRFGEGTTDNHRVVRRMLEAGYDGCLSIELSPEIGEADGRPFTPADLELPYRMFSIYETPQPSNGRRTGRSRRNA